MIDSRRVIKDASAFRGAQEIAERIKEYWYKRGYMGIKAEAVMDRTTKDDDLPRYFIRSNVGPSGFPPKE